MSRVLDAIRAANRSGPQGMVVVRRTTLVGGL